MLYSHLSPGAPVARWDDTGCVPGDAPIVPGSLVGKSSELPLLPLPPPLWGARSQGAQPPAAFSCSSASMKLGLEPPPGPSCQAFFFQETPAPPS